MKSTFLALATAGALVLSAAPAFADDAPAAPPAAPASAVADSCGCCPQTCCDRGIVVWAEALYMKFHPAVSDYATEADATARPIGSIREAVYDYELGLRGGVAFRRPGSDTGIGIQVTWANPDLDTTATAVAPNFIGLTHGTANAGLGFTQGGSIAHHDEIDYLVVDAGFCHHASLGCNGTARLYGGARFARIDHSTDDLTSTAAGVAVESLVATSDLTGFGFAMGGELRWGFCSGWTVWGRAASGILLSSIDASAVNVLNPTGAALTLVNTTNSIDRVTPFVEMGIGFGWGCPRFLGSCIGLQVDVGWELTNWFNVLDPYAYIDDVRDSEFDQESDDLGIDAFSLKITLTF